MGERAFSSTLLDRDIDFTKMAITLEETRIKEKMQGIINIWKDKPEKDDTDTLHIKRTIDRMKFRNLRWQLEKLEKYGGGKYDSGTVNGPVDIVAFATELFGA